jgi:hypothetical protein
MGIILFLTLLAAMGASLRTVRSQPGFRLSPALAATASSAAFPLAGIDGVPAAVEQLTIAFDGWGGDVIDPWQYIGTGMMQSYLNLRLLHHDEQMHVVPLWATE